MTLSDEEYIEKRELFENVTLNKLKDRPLELFINACTGMEILNEVCEEIIGEEFNPIDYYECILKNVLDENVGTEEDGPSSIAVEMLKDFDELCQENSIKAKDYEAGSNETSKYV